MFADNREIEEGYLEEMQEKDIDTTEHVRKRKTRKEGTQKYMRHVLNIGSLYYQTVVKLSKNETQGSQFISGVMN